MKVDRFIRVAIAFLILAAFLVATGALLFVTDTAMNVWERLAEGPAVIRYAYVGTMALVFLAAIGLIWRLVIRRKIKAPEPDTAKPMSKEDIEGRLREAEAAGVDVEEAQAELQELAARREAGYVHLCFFGEVSSGKGKAGRNRTSRGHSSAKCRLR